MRPRKINPPHPISERMAPLELLRFLKFVQVDEATRCWNWTGHRDGKGYGQFSLRGRMVWAHRISFANFRHKLRSCKEIDHRCGNPSCVNPDHLRPLTHSANSIDANRRRAVVAAAADDIPF